MATFSENVGAACRDLLAQKSNGGLKMTAAELQLLQSLPLEDKIKKSQIRIREWYEYWCGQIYISFSGGKDSTVLLHLVRSLYPEIPAVFSDTGLEYPEIREFALKQRNVIVIRPTLNFRDVLGKYGYPVVSKAQARYIYEIRNTRSEKLRDLRLSGQQLPDGKTGKLGMLSKRWRYLIDAPFKISDECCRVLKKRPFEIYEKKSGRRAMTGEMAYEGRRRKTRYLMYGCNSFTLKRPKSSPLGFWMEQDVLRYLKDFQIPYSKVYGDIIEREDGALATTGCERTGCMFCMFGLHLDKNENRFVRMKRTHPKLWSYCIGTLEIGEVLDYMGIPYGRELYQKTERREATV
jgi:3'-phosphoadenosine 5'-phosphosulfate sulfotransferase (PAPS reductase)/FAD synthetase